MPPDLKKISRQINKETNTQEGKTSYKGASALRLQRLFLRKIIRLFDTKPVPYLAKNPQRFGRVFVAVVSRRNERGTTRDNAQLGGKDRDIGYD